MTVRAPFRFAPINDRVHFPAWGALASHDVPFSDGLCGEIGIEIEAKTALLIGGPRRKARTAEEVPPHGEPGEVRPFMSAGQYAIPGSTIQGMARSILEVAALGRLGPFVAERRFGLRDITSDTGIRFYRDRMLGSQAGWLVKHVDPTSKIVAKIVLCKFARIDFDELRALGGGQNPDPLEQKNDADTRYEWFLNRGPLSALNQPVFIEQRTQGHPRAHRQNDGKRQPAAGTVVFTGKPQTGINRGHKKLEFVFHTPDRTGASTSNKVLDVPPEVWRDFDLIHGEQRGRKENPNWAFWKGEFEAGRPVPIFYLLDGGKIATMGTAFMFKTAMKLSTHEMLGNSNADHVREKPDGTTDPRLDLPSLIFGDVADHSGNQGLKRRASFDLAYACADPPKLADKIGRAILLEPKPSYYPSYVRQPGDHAEGKLNTGLYAIYEADPRAAARERKTPELAGVKVWPARNGVSANVRPPHLEKQFSIQTTLCPLQKGARFRTVLRFHNLRPVELGAVLWALSFGKAAAWTEGADVGLRHRMGMGKPYGLGEVAIRILPGTFHADRNDGGAVPAIVDLVDAFTAEMTVVIPGWRNLPQMRTLLAAANPEFKPPQGASLEYMILNPRGGPDEFGQARMERRFLPDYMAEPEAPDHDGPAPPQSIAGTPGEARLGARARVAHLEGTIVEMPADPKNPQFLVLIDGQTKPRRYPARIVEVIG